MWINPEAETEAEEETVDSDKEEDKDENGNVDDWLLFVLNHLAKCQTYFMLEYSAYASVCHVTFSLSVAQSFSVRPGNAKFRSGPYLLRSKRNLNLNARHLGVARL